MAQVKVDFTALDKLRGRVRGLAAEAFQAKLGKALGARALELVRDGFKAERDPYGHPWAPLQTRKGKILRKTGRLMASATVRQRPHGFAVLLTAAYARTHQRGAVIRPVRARALRFRVGNRWVYAQKVTIPRRQMVPEQDTGGWGPLWLAAFQTEAQALVKQHFSGVGS